jgi:RNA-splicing ligase RtcB
VNQQRLQELLYQALETEMGGVQVYQTALRCAVHEELRTEWQEYLVKAMEMALAAGDPEAAELVAAECVVHAETKDHLNWELIGMITQKLKDETGEALKDAYEEVEEEEDEHLYHTMGWSRELWIKGLGMPAVLPPPEEEKDVKTAIGAARAKMARGTMRKAS